MADVPRQNPLFVRHWGLKRPALLQDWQEATNFVLYGLGVTPDTRVVRTANRYEYRKPDYSAALKPVDYCNVACLSTPAAPTALPPGDVHVAHFPLRKIIRQDYQDTLPVPLVLQPGPLVLPANNVAWPVPRGQQRFVQDWIQAGNALTGVAALTVNPGFNEWFNPSGYRPLVQDWIAQTNIALMTTVVVVSMPPGRAHFDNPPLKKAGRQDYQETLSMPLVLQPGPLIMPANQAAWPVPRDQRRNLADWQDYILPWAQAPPFNYDWPNPRGVRRPLQDWTASTNIALTTVVVVTPPPPHQTDWPNPRGAGRHVAWQGWADKLIVDILPPPANYDWPLTPGRRRNPQDWIAPTSAALKAGPVVPPPIAKDWPVPRAAQRNPQDWIWASNPASIPEPPVYLLRAATRYEYREPDYSAALKWCDNYNVALLFAPPPPPPPIAQRDWPVPKAARRNPQDWIQPSNPASIPEPPTVNPGFNEWFNPWGPRRGPQDWVQASPLALTVVIVPTLFREPTIWRRDVPTSAAQTTPLGSVTVRLAPAVVVTAPRANYDWPNPRGPRRHVAWEGWTSSLFVDVLPPPANYDWPNPRAPRRNPQDWIRSVSTFTIFVERPPIAQSDWPNPRGARRNPQDWSDRFKLPLQSVLPPTQKNWPLPTPAARRNPQDYIEPTNIALVTTVQIMPPIAQHDWPVPKGALQPVITARDFVAGFNPPVDPVYDPDNTLENEIRRIRDLTNRSGRIRYLKNEVRS